jgi:hypothetical protein
MPEKNNDQVFALAAELRKAKNRISQLEVAIKSMQRLLLRESQLAVSVLKLGGRTAVDKTSIECGTAEDVTIYVCADDANAAKKAAEQQAYKDYECVGAHCMLTATASSAKRTWVECQIKKPEWEVKVTLSCAKIKK